MNEVAIFELPLISSATQHSNITITHIIHINSQELQSLRVFSLPRFFSSLDTFMYLFGSVGYSRQRKRRVQEAPR